MSNAQPANTDARNIFIPSDVFDGLTHDFAKRLNDGLTRCMVSGKFEPRQIAEILAENNVLPADAMRQIINDMCDDAHRQAESMVPAVTRSAA